MFVVLTRLAAAAPTVVLRHARAASALLLQQVNELRSLREQLTALFNLISIAYNTLLNLISSTNNKTMCNLDFKNMTLGRNALPGYH